MEKLSILIDDLLKDSDLGEVLEKCNLIGASSYLNENEEIEKWEINFYDPEKNKAYKVDIDKDYKYEIYEAELISEKEKFANVNLRSDEILIDEQKALNIAQKHYMENFKNKETTSIIIVLDAIQKAWAINLITKDLTIIQIPIDITTGKVLEVKEVQLAHVA